MSVIIQRRLSNIRAKIIIDYDSIILLVKKIDESLKRLQDDIDELESIKEEMKNTDNINEAIHDIDNFINEISGMKVDYTLVLKYINAAIETE